MRDVPFSLVFIGFAVREKRGREGVERERETQREREWERKGEGNVEADASHRLRGKNV